MMARKHLVLFIFVLILGAAGVAAFLLRDQMDPAWITAGIDGLGVWTPVLFIAAFTISAVFFFPSPLFALAGGVLFGPVWGTVINLAGSAGGAALAFVIARYFAADWVSRRTEGVLYRVIQGVEEEGWRAVALMRLAPFLPYNLVNYAFGLTRISLRVYLAATIICKTPGMLAYAWMGHAGEAALNGDHAAIQYVLLGLGVLAVVAFLPHLIQRIRKKAA